MTDNTSRKDRPFIVVVAVMLATTLLLFLSNRPEMIIIARILQGASAALVWVSGMAFMVSRLDESRLGEYVGYAMMAATLGELAGPILGGPLYDKSELPSYLHERGTID